jgi:hypothetical protein
MDGNGDLVATISRLLDDKLAPLARELIDMRSEMRDGLANLSDSLKRINIRLAVVEAVLGIDPFKPKH